MRAATDPATDLLLTDLPLPSGVRSRLVEDINGLRLHVLEAGDPAAPCLLLLHGFPELAYSWRHQLAPLAEAGYHVLAPDQRGFGRTTGWPAGYDGDLRPFGLLNLARDALGLLAATGHREAAAVIGHDFGSLVAAWCALLRPDVFRPSGADERALRRAAALPGWGAPAARPTWRPRWPHCRGRASTTSHYGTREANAEMWHAPQGVHAFLRAYYHVKSADWPGNRPQPLPDWRAETLAQMPTYYIMDRDQGMAQTVAAHRPTPAQVAACRWLPEADLAVYAAEYTRTGCQGGLHWYRCSTHPPCVAEQQMFAETRIEVPTAYIAGAADWGIYQKPGELQRMQQQACRRFQGLHLWPAPATGAAGAARRRAAAAAGLRGRRMTPLPLNEVFKLAPGPVPALMFVRVALAVGVPMLGFTLAGQPLLAVAAGATAMFVTLCDVGSSTRSRAAMMGLGTLAILLGAAGDKFGGGTGIDGRWSSPRPFRRLGEQLAARAGGGGATARWPRPQAWARRSLAAARAVVAGGPGRVHGAAGLAGACRRHRPTWTARRPAAPQPVPTPGRALPSSWR